MEVTDGSSAGPAVSQSFGPSPATDNGSAIQWTAVLIVRAIGLFLLAGVAEIGGGWLIWQSIREHKPWWLALLGCLVLIAYGFVPTAQPTDNFGRIYAVYGGFFIVLSYLWAWAVDGKRPDLGDWIGTAVALVGVCIAMFWRR